VVPQEQAELLDTYSYKMLVDSVVTISQHPRQYSCPNTKIPNAC
jgi:hypothetical protein